MDLGHGALKMPVEPSSRDPVPVSGNVPMDRIRVGITGLAAVILLVALATAVATSVQRGANASEAGAPVVVTGAAMPNTSDKAEPLEQLGMTPPVEKNASAAAGAPR